MNSPLLTVEATSSADRTLPLYCSVQALGTTMTVLFAINRLPKRIVHGLLGVRRCWPDGRLGDCTYRPLGCQYTDRAPG